MKDDLYSPDSSPGELNASGVRRVNNLPLIIAIGILVIFALTVAMVAVKRGQQQQSASAEPVKVVKRADSSVRMADEIINGHESGIIPAAQAPIQEVKVTETKTLALPVALVNNPELPPMPPEVQPAPDDDNEITRIRQEKIRQFEEAVKAKMTIDAKIQAPLMSPDNAKTEELHLPGSLPMGDTTARFQEKLRMMQMNMKGAADNAATLGGSEDAGRWELHAKVEVPTTPFELKTGSVIPGVMISGIKSTLPGQIIGQVSQHVFDTATGRFLLIPQGTRLLGVYSNQVAYGQNVMLVAWQRMIFPDGKTLDIGSMSGTDSAGYTGFHDKTNNHYMRTFGSAILMSGIVAGVTLSQNQNDNDPWGQPNANSALSQALGQQLGEVTAQMIAKNLNIAPTLEIRPGYPFSIMVTKDLVFDKPWQPFDYRLRRAA